MQLAPSSSHNKLERRSESKRSMQSSIYKQQEKDEPSEFLKTEVKITNNSMISNIQYSNLVKSQIEDKIMLNHAKGQQMLLDESNDYYAKNK